jgi:hypothetical protein
MVTNPNTVRPTKWKRRLLVFGVFVIILTSYLWLFGIQTFFALQTRYWSHRIPIIKSVPLELQDLTISKSRGEKVAFDGVEFEVPWSDVDEQKSKIVGNWALIFFRSGNSILLCVTPPKDLMTSIFSKKYSSPELFTMLYGPDVLKSDYTFTKAIFETTPAQITLFTPSNRAAGLGSVILLKGIMPPTTDWAIYTIRSKDLCGFQLGEPRRRPRKMSLELYGEEREIEININQVQSGPVPITQADLNRIIETTHRTGTAKPVLTINPS